MPGANEFHLMNRWQRGFPLVARPYSEIGALCGLPEERVIEIFRRLKEKGCIDRIGPVFRPNMVGASMLAAMAVPAARLDGVAALVSRSAQVNHNYEREHRFNLWFVVAGADAATVENEVLLLEEQTGLAIVRLPLLEEFHIDLGFDLADGAAPRDAAMPVAAPALSRDEQRLVARLAQGVPITARPYAELGLPEESVIKTLRAWLHAGIVRRIGTVVRHRRLGYEANAMVVWDVPDEWVAQFGRLAAADSAVTLCYRRVRAAPQWPYNLYCMVHGRARERVLDQIEHLSGTTGLAAFARAVLFSRRCFTQRGARYLTEVGRG